MKSSELKQRFLDLIKKQNHKFFHKEGGWQGDYYYLTIKIKDQKDKMKLHQFFSEVVLVEEKEWNEKETLKDYSIHMVDFGIQNGNLFADWGLWSAIQTNQFRLKQAISIFDFIDFLRYDDELFKAFIEIYKHHQKHPLDEGVYISMIDIHNSYLLRNFCQQYHIPFDLNNLVGEEYRFSNKILINRKGIFPVICSPDEVYEIYSFEEFRKYIHAYENMEW